MNIAEFDELYAVRHQDESRDKCLAATRDPIGYAWLWRAARLKHFLAMQFLDAGDKAAAQSAYAAGAGWAKLAELEKYDEVEGAFWKAVCDLEVAQLQGKLAAGLALPAAEKRLNRCCGLNEGYHYAGPVRILGRIYHLRPLLLGGNLDRALAFHRRSLQLYPDNSTNLLYTADALLADRQPNEARVLIHRVLELEPVKDWVWETERDRRLAREWLRTRLD